LQRSHAWRGSSGIADRFRLPDIEAHRQEIGAKDMSVTAGCYLFFAMAFVLLLNGCAVHHFDPKTGTEHLWGFGHLKMKTAPQESSRPVITGTRLLGVSVRGGRDNYGISAGWESNSRITMPASGTLVLQYPTNAAPLPREMRDFFTIRVGTNLPPGWETPERTNPISPQR
jgi:hypothetical protein